MIRFLRSGYWYQRSGDSWYRVENTSTGWRATWVSRLPVD